MLLVALERYKRRVSLGLVVYLARAKAFYNLPQHVSASCSYLLEIESLNPAMCQANQLTIVNTSLAIFCGSAFA